MHSNPELDALKLEVIGKIASLKTLSQVQQVAETIRLVKPNSGKNSSFSEEELKAAVVGKAQIMAGEYYTLEESMAELRKVR